MGKPDRESYRERINLTKQRTFLFLIYWSYSTDVNLMKIVFTNTPSNNYSFIDNNDDGLLKDAL